MSSLRLLGIAGSLRKGSLNRALLYAIGETLPEAVTLDSYDRLGDIPVFDPDAPETPEPVLAFKHAIAAADGLVIVTPEYNYSIPGFLKNAIDWASARHRGSWLRNKTVAIAGVTTGQYGAIWAQQDLRRILGIVGARVVDGDFPVSRAQDVFDADGRLASPLLEDRLRNHLVHLVAVAAPVSLAA